MKLDSKGSISVFLVLILAAMVGVVMIFINVSAGSALKSYSDSMLNMSARAVLSEFDLDLKEDYGIFAFYEPNAEGKIRHYLDACIKEKNSYTEIDSLAVMESDYKLTDIANFRDSITEYVKYLKMSDMLAEDSEVKERNVTHSDAVLRNRSVIDTLPSHECGKTGNVIQKLEEVIENGLPSYGDFIEAGSDNILENEYIMECFKNTLHDFGGHNTFFKNEVEYIISGVCEDEVNRKKVRRMIITLREAVNFSFIYTNPKMRTEVIALAESISPGPGAVLMQLAIASAWALVESENDMALLEHGRKVPVKKTLQSWATDIESAVKGASEGYIDTGVNTGYSYDTYLRLLLFCEDETVKLLRTMDLIQINMKGNYNRAFLLKEYCCGMRIEATVNGNKFRYEHRY